MVAAGLAMQLQMSERRHGSRTSGLLPPDNKSANTNWLMRHFYRPPCLCCALNAVSCRASRPKHRYAPKTPPHPFKVNAEFSELNLNTALRQRSICTCHCALNSLGGNQMARFVFLFSCMLIVTSGVLVFAQFDDITGVSDTVDKHASIESCMQTRDFCGNL